MPFSPYFFFGINKTQINFSGLLRNEYSRENLHEDARVEGERKNLLFMEIICKRSNLRTLKHVLI